uniref:Uncharacterized protein n=1 Tax=viral metagenome TaxID=1070528 RepID=A0A6H1ZJB5_9ZZZZ
MGLFVGGGGVRTRLLESDQYRNYMDILRRKLSAVPAEEAQERMQDAVKVGEALERMVLTDGWKILTTILEEKLDIGRFLLGEVSEEEKRRFEMEAKLAAQIFVHVGGLIEHGQRVRELLTSGGKDE